MKLRLLEYKLKNYRLQVNWNLKKQFLANETELLKNKWLQEFAVKGNF